MAKKTKKKAKKENLKNHDTLELQLITVELGNGQRGVFIGSPLVVTEIAHKRDEINGIWFSNIQNIPKHITVEQLTSEVNEQIKNCLKTIH